MRKSRSRAIGKPLVGAGLPVPPPGGAHETGAAVKTYLQEQVALLRPQVADTEMAHLFRFGVTVWAAAGYRAEALRQVDFVLADKDGKPLKNLDKYGAAVQQSLRFRWPSLIERSEVSFCFYGSILWRRLYNDKTGAPAGYQWINNNFFQPDTDPWDGLRGFNIRSVWGSDIDRAITYIPTEDAVYMHNIDFFEDFGGVGPAQVAYVQAALETEIGATQLQFFRNMAMPNFALQPAAGVGYNIGVDDKNTLTELMRRMYQGAANAGRTVVLPTRWEMIKFQQDFDKLGMPQLTAEAKSAIIEAMRVPLELLDPRQTNRSSGTKFYDQKREWLISWLIPQSERYHQEFTEQIAQPLNPDWQIVPLFGRVRGLEEDVSSKTDTVQKQTTMAVLDLYTAQESLGIKPDPALKGLYMIGGVPVPADQMQDYWRASPGMPGQVQGNFGEAQGGEIAKPDKPKRKGAPKPDPLPLSSGEKPNKKSVIPFLPDEQWHEVKNWRLIVERKGVAYQFEGKSLAPDVVAYGKFLLGTGTNVEQSFDAIRDIATKSYDDTERSYRAGLYSAMLDAFNGSLNRNQFGITGRQEISLAFLNAFKNGMESKGVDPSEMDEEEKAALDLETKSERGYWTNLANTMFSEVIPLRGELGFDVAKERMLARIDLWVSAGLERVYQLGQLYATMSSMKKWILGGTLDHCDTCAKASGQVHRSRTWVKSGILPGSAETCICKGIKCACRLEDTTDRASGRLDSVPVAAGAKSEEQEELAHSEIFEVIA